MPASRAPTAAVADSHWWFAGVASTIGGKVRRGGRKVEGGGKRKELCDACPSNQHGSCDLRVGLNDSSLPSTNHMTMSTFPPSFGP